MNTPQTPQPQDLASSASAPEASTPPEPLFQPFQWLDSQSIAHELPAWPALELYSNTRDIASGVCTVLQILERQRLDAVTGTAPLFSPCDEGSLMRLAIASLGLLGLEAERFSELAQRHPRHPSNPPRG